MRYINKRARQPAAEPNGRAKFFWTLGNALMLVGIVLLLYVGGVYLLWRKSDDQEWQLRLGTLLPALLWIAQGSSFAFPGARGLEAELPELVPKIAGVYVNERFSSTLILALLGAVYLLARRRALNV